MVDYKDQIRHTIPWKHINNQERVDTDAVRIAPVMEEEKKNRTRWNCPSD